MKLYYFPLSTFSQKVLIALYEKQVAFEPQVVDLQTDEGRAKYREFYPLGKVPVLVRDDERMIPESSIIIEYLDRASDKGPKLIPDDPERGRETRFKDRMIDLYLNDSVVSLLFEDMKPAADRDQALIDRCNFRINVIYGFMDKNLADNTWMMGDDFTIADCATAPVLFYAQQYAPFEQRGNIVAYWKRIQERSSFREVLAEAKPYLDMIKGDG